MSSDLALVTGAPGWLGNRLLHFLRNPHPDYPDGAPSNSYGRVRCLVLPNADTDRLRKLVPDVEFVAGDIRDADAVGRFCAGGEGATVFHMAGIIHPKRVKEFFEINTDGTKNLIAAATGAGVKRIVATSSNSPIGAARKPSTLFDERSPYKPYMAYGRSKQLMEEALNQADRSGAVETTIIRPCWYYGPEQPPRQTLFFQMIKEGKAPIVGSGEAMRSMSYVDNTSLGMLLAAAVEEAKGRTYWITDGRPYSMNEIIDTVEEILEKDFGLPVAHKRMKLPAIASDVAYVADAMIQKTGLYQQKIHVLSEMAKTIAASPDRAREELGYKPSVELREGMRRSIDWCLQNGQTI
jgi:nucleoside-diphosphate-sugar epimerase